MRSAITALLKNLQALKAEGVERVVVADETLTALKTALGEFSNTNVPAENVPANFADASPASIPEAPACKRVAVAGMLAPDPVPEFPPAPKINVPETGTKTERLEALREMVFADAICKQHCRAGKQLVFGVGNPDSPVFFCGEAPGVEEEAQGEPFVGPAGQLLTKIITATGMTRESVYIGNIMKWRPEMPTVYGNRPPTEAEMAYCLPYLGAQIEIIKPRVIVALGLTAVNGLLGYDPDRKMGAMRGKTFDFRGVPVVPTYHPSYLLRNGTLKSKRLVWEDFMIMIELLGLPISEKQRGFFLPKI